MPGMLELSAVEWNPAGIARLCTPDDQQTVTGQRIVGKSDGLAAERLGYGPLEVRTARRAGVNDHGRMLRRRRPRAASG